MPKGQDVLTREDDRLTHWPGHRGRLRVWLRICFDRSFVRLEVIR